MKIRVKKSIVSGSRRKFIVIKMTREHLPEGLAISPGHPNGLKGR